MESMIERVARALRRQWSIDNFDRPSDVGWQDEINAARAAIAAMKEPTETMISPEGVHIGFINDADGIEDNLYIDEDDARAIWQAMIDAALNEQVAG